jgi:manganese/zinc/iron transport system permease protein
VIDWLPYNTRIVLIGTSLLGASCGLVGCFAVLRRRSLIGEAVAHAALPGVGLGFLVVQSRSMPALLTGALITGLVGVMIVSLLRSSTRTKEDAAIGIVLGVAPAIGFVLLRWIQSHTSTGSKAGLDSYIFGKTAGMTSQDVYVLAGVSSLCLGVILLLYKEFKAIAFDPGFARAQGWPSLMLDFLLTGLIALTVVVGLPAVGSLLITAMLIIPAISARFWTDRLGHLLLLSSLLGAAVGATGTALSSRFDASPAGPVIVLVGAAAFVVSMLVAPHRGVATRMASEANFRSRLAHQKLLRAIAKIVADRPGSDSFAVTEISERQVKRVQRLDGLVRMGLLVPVDRERYRLTQAGRDAAERVVRGYRLWEAFLLSYPELARSYADLDAESVDNLLPAATVRELEARLQREGRWPKAAPTV